MTYECYLVQPRPDSRNGMTTPSENITQLLISNRIVNEVKNCNITIPSNILELCSSPFHPMDLHAYFNYNLAICTTLYDALERLCNVKKIQGLKLEDSALVEKNASGFCRKMGSAFNNFLSDSKDTERKKWISELKDRMNDDKKCKEGCIHTEGEVNPLCSTLLQINYHVTNVSEKHNTAASGAETTKINEKPSIETVSIDHKEPSDFQLENALKEQLENTSPNVQQEKKIHMSSTQEGESLVSHKASIKTESTVSTVPKTQNNVPNGMNQNTDNFEKDEGVIQQPTLNVPKNIGESDKKQPPSSNPADTNEEPAVNTLPADTEGNEEKNKALPIAKENIVNTDKPSTKSEDNTKETNMNKPPTDAEENDEVLGRKPISEITKQSNLDDTPTIGTNSYTKKISPKTEDVNEPAQAQSPDT
ncbi:hypothetical protein L9F63_004362, partial [Diploptera punctata]